MLCCTVAHPRLTKFPEGEGKSLYVFFCIGASISIGREIWCLPYAGFLFYTNNQVTGDTWEVTHDTWHMTCDMWHMTHYIWCEVNILSKFQLSGSNGLGIMMLWISGGKGWLTHSLSDWIMTKLFVELPRLHQVC